MSQYNGGYMYSEIPKQHLKLHKYITDLKNVFFVCCVSMSGGDLVLDLLYEGFRILNFICF